MTMWGWLACLLLAANLTARAETFLILPFFNASKSTNLDWVGESLSETIREALASEGVIALDRDDRMEVYRRLSLRPTSLLTKASVIRVAEALDAEQVIFGSYELIPAEGNAPKARGSLRVTAQILDIKKLTRGPEYMELGALEDLARLQSHLAWETLQFVIPKRSPSEEEFKKRQAIVRVEAIEYYVRGLLAASAEQKAKLFTQAVRIDPRYSQANFQLGRLQWEKKSYKAATEYLMKVAASDVHYREANFILGLCRYHLGEYGAAQDAFQMVATSIPLNEVWNNLGAAQSRKNNPEALENFKRALEGDSADPDYQFNVGYALFKQGNLAAAADRFRAVLDRDPEDTQAITMLGRCLKKTPARGTDLRAEGFERLKENYEETVYLQLKAMLEPKH
jgi:tetratricopeptide (TPR) repeat protein